MESSKKFAICIFTNENALLTLNCVYRVIPDEKAKRSDYIRIIDDEGEDYLYPKNYFVFVQIPQEVEKALFQIV